jgi:enoyl-CoA hydratase
MGYEFLAIEQNEGICTLTINSPRTLNALNTQVLDELGRFVDSIGSDVRVLIITGAGKAFVAGADISEMSSKNYEEGLEFGRFGAGVFRRLEQLPIPVIAAVNGYALGGGCELACACDIRIASERAQFGQPEVKLGIIPGFSGTYRLAKLIGQGRAKELIYTGRTMRADEALSVGLVNSVVSDEELLTKVNEIARMIVANAPIAVAKAKQSIAEGYDMNADEAIAFENRLFAECFSTEDQKEGMAAFLAKRLAEFKNK